MAARRTRKRRPKGAGTENLLHYGSARTLGGVRAERVYTSDSEPINLARSHGFPSLFPGRLSGELSMSIDLFAGFTQSFADKAIDSQKYPLTRRFERPLGLEPDAQNHGEVLKPEADVEPDPNYRADWGDPREGGEILELTIESFLIALAARNDGRQALLEEPEHELIALFADPIGRQTFALPDGSVKPIMELTGPDLAMLSGQGDRAALFGLGSLWNGIKNAVRKVARAFVRNLKEFLAKYFKFEVLWGEITVRSRPDVVVGNPLRLRKLDIAARVKIKACVKIGRWLCAEIASPSPSLLVGALVFTPEVKGPLVVGSARVENFDFVLDITIFGYRIPVRIGLTKVVNGILASQPPHVLLDTSNLSYPLPMLNTKFVPSGIAFSSKEDYFETDIGGQFVPI